MDRVTGGFLDGLDHIAQSIRDIVGTMIGTRVERRDYGSALPERLDRPLNPQTVLDIYADTIDAVEMWEPRATIERVQVDSPDPVSGRLRISLQAVRASDGEPFTVAAEVGP